MTDDVKIFDQWGTIEFTIDETSTDGVYDYPSGDTAVNFANISTEALVSLTDPINNSVSWNRLRIYLDPGEFYGYWGINNTEKLVRGFPTQMLYYDNQFVFRTLPDTDYTVQIFAYKQNVDYATAGNENIQRDYWLRYLAYGAAASYASDYRLEASDMNRIKSTFARERALVLGRAHDQIKLNRSFPRF
jgi:hypothetical protein